MNFCNTFFIYTYIRSKKWQFDRGEHFCKILKICLEFLVLGPNPVWSTTVDNLLDVFFLQSRLGSFHFPVQPLPGESDYFILQRLNGSRNRNSVNGHTKFWNMGDERQDKFKIWHIFKSARQNEQICVWVIVHNFQWLHREWIITKHFVISRINLLFELMSRNFWMFFGTGTNSLLINNLSKYVSVFRKGV